jgi:YfiH family protein
VANVDGIVTNTGLPLAVISADCVPLLAVAPKAKLSGVAHAGWRGTIGNIAKNLIDTMVAHGADITDIKVAIGPAIGFECYNVGADRAKLFTDVFGTNADIVVERAGTWFLHLAAANKKQLLDAGVSPEHIDQLAVCTSCHAEGLYSYRKNTDPQYGEIAGVIGFSSIVH